MLRLNIKPLAMLCTIAFVLTGNFAFSQDSTVTGFSCGADNYLFKARKNALYKSREAVMNREIANTPVPLDVSYTLPVVFHIISETPDEIQDAQIEAALQDLNDAFGKTGKYITSTGADTRIRFCMARTDPYGGKTNGITRTTSLFGSDLNRTIEDEKLKALIKWDPEHYINIWFVRNIQDESYADFTCAVIDGSQWKRVGTLGYATMPIEPLDTADGIVVSEFGSVLAHEMGHYLGLYHTYEGGCNNNDCTVNGDKVCDTPPETNYWPSPCGDSTNSCRSDTLSNYSNGFFRQDVPDQTENFMDFNNWSCAIKFTNGQGQRMRSAIAALRPGLIGNKCTPPCNENLVAQVSRNVPYPTPGEQIVFVNNTAASNFRWYINDSLVSSARNYSVSFPDTGMYNITMKAYNNNANCFVLYSDNVFVTCGVSARFFADKRRIASKTGFALDSIVFKNTSFRASSFEWLVSNDAGMAETAVSKSRDLTYIFLQPGLYQVRLVASNATCTDTTGFFEVPVADPTPDLRPNLAKVECYEETKVRVRFSVCNNGYTEVDPNTPITFYDGDPRRASSRKIGSTFLLPEALKGGGTGSCCSQQYTVILDAGRRGLNQVYMAVNDRGNAVPVKFPGSNTIERNYDNNIDFERDFRIVASATPPSATVLPGDTIQLIGGIVPETTPANYRWIPATGLSCRTCDTTLLIADSSRIYSVIATTENGCSDTADVSIKVPVANDFAILIDGVTCTDSNDSLNVAFTVINNYKYPVLPKNLAISFYDGNPLTAVQNLLKPGFLLPSTYNREQVSFTTKIKISKSATVFAVVNDAGTSFPLKLPNTLLNETNYSNNIASGKFEPINVTATNGGTICENDTIRLTATSNTPGVAFAWSGPGGYKSNEQNPVISRAGASASGVYSVIASINDCASAPANTTVSVATAPVVSASASNPVCENGTLRLSANSNATGTYSWTGPGDFTSNIQNPTIDNVQRNQSGQYRVTVKTNSNCLSKQAVALVTVNATPDAAFTAPDICLPSTSVAFTNESTITRGSISGYEWNFGDAQSSSNVSNESNPTHVYPGSGTYNVRLTAISDSGCRATISKQYSGINPQPLAYFVNNKPGGICINVPVSFSDKSVAGNGTITKWTWLAGDGSAAVVYNSASANFEHTYKAPGVYQVQLLVENGFGCASDTTQPVTVFAPPEVDAGPDQYVLEGNSVQLYAKASADVVSYRWTPLTFLNNPATIQPLVNRPMSDVTYTLTVTNGNGCTASDTVLVKLLRNINIPNAFSPNGDGVNDVWNVRYLADYPGCLVDIFDRYGTLVFHSTGYNNPWDGTRNGKPAPIGVYYYIITPKNGAATVNGSVTLLR